MPAAEGNLENANFAVYTDNVLFSSMLHDFTEANYDNVQPVERFALHDLFHDLDFAASVITP